MAGYSGTPLFKKLGYKPGTVAIVINSPASYRRLLELPVDVVPIWRSTLNGDFDLIHVFATKASELVRLAAQSRNHLMPAGALWISWPKKASGVITDITEDKVRETVFPLDLVDIKVCAVDETWSGLKCVIRKELR